MAHLQNIKYRCHYLHVYFYLKQFSIWCMYLTKYKETFSDSMQHNFHVTNFAVVISHVNWINTKDDIARKSQRTRLRSTFASWNTQTTLPVFITWAGLLEVIHLPQLIILITHVLSVTQFQSPYKRTVIQAHNKVIIKRENNYERQIVMNGREKDSSRRTEENHNILCNKTDPTIDTGCCRLPKRQCNVKHT